MKTRSNHVKRAVFCTLITLFLSLTALHALSQEAPPEGAAAEAEKSRELTGGSQDSVPAQEPAGELSPEKPLEKSDSNCTACHSTCVDSKHCKKFGAAWDATNCQKCHTPHPHKKN